MEPTSDAGPAGPTAVEAAAGKPDKQDLPYQPGLRQTMRALYEIKIHTVFFMVAASLGLGLIAPQVSTIAVLVVFAVFWGATVIAMLALAARMMSARGAGNGRHRRVAHS
ncbi:hypothetical protein P3T36_001260 [Kitasatospora sp. MAP12-15]|uniref:hypothetical protein n=1 Tax=unclassified Kitasatospora TaxID=2633591 RepID=UPI0024758F3D|nr:hypothetical protein [Kitasatospora sp. MAP12-44]MDH6114911.1 hypothetical protein [Kitasatospora sp. MAP12-44]